MAGGSTVRSGLEIQVALEKFVAKWSGFTGSEKAEAQTFLNELFRCYSSDRTEVGAKSLIGSLRDNRCTISSGNGLRQGTGQSRAATYTVLEETPPVSALSKSTVCAIGLPNTESRRAMNSSSGGSSDQSANTPPTST